MFDASPGKGEKNSSMNLKRWFLWLCLAVIVVGEIMLFRATQQRNNALAQLSQARHEAAQARQDLDQFKASAEAVQGAAGDRLRRDNQKLTQAITLLKSETNRLQQANQQLTQQLAAVSETAQQQRARLQQWDAASQQAQDVIQQSQSQAAADREACIANLKLIEAAKLQWAIDHNKTENDIPTVQDLQPYFKDGDFPTCPAGGTYTINALGEPPTCSIPGHALPQPQ